MSSDPLQKYFHDVSANIRRNRIKQGLTLEELGDLIGTTRQYIHKIENGLPLTVRTVVALSVALKVEVGDILRSDRIPPLNSIIKYKERKPKNP